MDARPADVRSKPILGDCLRAARRTRGLTLKAVASRTGIALSTLSKVENHQMSLTYDKLLQLSAGLEMEIAELFHPPGSAAPAAPLCTARRSIARAGEGQLVQTEFYSYLYQCTDLLGLKLKRCEPRNTDVLCTKHARRQLACKRDRIGHQSR